MADNDEMKEMCAIGELKQRFKDHPDMYDDEHLFYRFLKARHFNIDHAETMLKNHLEWRKTNDVNSILECQPHKVLQNYLPFVMLGHDKKGCVVRYVPSGNIDWIGIALSVKTEDLIRKVIYDTEDDIRELKKQSKKIGRTVNQCVFIHDLQNLSFATATNKRVILDLISIFNLYQNNYPEMLKAIYVINASMYFSMIFSALKKCISSSILNKIKIYGDDSYKEDLLQIIDADVLPSFLGGNKTDPDGNPLCITFINRAGHIPNIYYTHRSKRTLVNTPGVKKVILSNAAYHEVNLEVKEPGSYLEWEFETKSRDIGFGLFHKKLIDGEENNIELIPIQRINTDEYADTGLYLCEEGGNYIMVFDNTYSWVRAKEIFYRVEVTSPKDQESEL